MSQRISLTSYMANIQIRFFTWRHGEQVGTDQFGNRYFREKKPAPGRRERRWVLYVGEPEATNVPPEWHGWLHHQQAEPLKPGSPFHKPWMREHQPNTSGSPNAYRPPGHPLAGGERASASGDYEPWTPS